MNIFYLASFLINLLNFLYLVDIPIYILGPTTKTQEETFFKADQIDDGQEIYENILYLGKSKLM